MPLKPAKDAGEQEGLVRAKRNELPKAVLGEGVLDAVLWFACCGNEQLRRMRPDESKKVRARAAQIFVSMPSRDREVLVAWCLGQFGESLPEKGVGLRLNLNPEVVLRSIEASKRVLRTKLGKEFPGLRLRSPGAATA